MPPKKAPKEEKKALLGRPGNNLKIGIVGLFPVQHLLVPYRTLGILRRAKCGEIVLLQHVVENRFVSSIISV